MATTNPYFNPDGTMKSGILAPGAPPKMGAGPKIQKHSSGQYYDKYGNPMMSLQGPGGQQQTGGQSSYPAFVDEELKKKKSKVNPSQTDPPQQQPGSKPGFSSAQQPSAGPRPRPGQAADINPPGQKPNTGPSTQPGGAPWFRPMNNQPGKGIGPGGPTRFVPGFNPGGGIPQMPPPPPGPAPGGGGRGDVAFNGGNRYPGNMPDPFKPGIPPRNPGDRFQPAAPPWSPTAVGGNNGGYLPPITDGGYDNGQNRHPNIPQSQYVDPNYYQNNPYYGPGTGGFNSGGGRSPYGPPQGPPWSPYGPYGPNYGGR